MLSTGTKLGPYEILAPLGAGGMGEVYRVRDSRLGREVAIKVLPESFSKDPDRLRRFEQEARAASQLNPSQYRYRARFWDARWCALRRPGAPRSGDAARAPARRRPSRAQGGGLRYPSGARTGSGSRERNCPTRPQAGEPVTYLRRPAAAPR